MMSAPLFVNINGIPIMYAVFQWLDSTRRPGDDPISVETCNRSYKIKVDLFDVHFLCCLLIINTSGCPISNIITFYFYQLCNSCPKTFTGVGIRTMLIFLKVLISVPGYKHRWTAFQFVLTWCFWQNFSLLCLRQKIFSYFPILHILTDNKSFHTHAPKCTLFIILQYERHDKLPY